MPGDFSFRNLTHDVRECMLREIDQKGLDATHIRSLRKVSSIGSTAVVFAHTSLKTPTTLSGFIERGNPANPGGNRKRRLAA